MNAFCVQEASNDIYKKNQTSPLYVSVHSAWRETSDLTKKDQSHNPREEI